MARPSDTDRYELSETEKRDLIKLIKEGKPLPEKYRFLLFADKREVELVWNGSGELPGVVSGGDEFIDFEERWTGNYIFENEWQSLRTRQDRGLDLTTASPVYPKPGRYAAAVKIVDIFGNDTMTLVPVNVG